MRTGIRGRGEVTIPPEPGDHLRVVAIIHSRTNSTSPSCTPPEPFPEKPVLARIAEQLGRSQFVERIAIATSRHPRDDRLAEWGQENKFSVVRGAEDDMLGWFARAAEVLDADIIVRASSGATNIDPGLVDHLVIALIEQDADYVLPEVDAEAIDGHLETFTRRALDKLMMDARDDPLGRGHMTDYFKLHPGFVRTVRAGRYPSPEHNPGSAAIDARGDLAFVLAVHDRMAAKDGEAPLCDLLRLLERERSSNGQRVRVTDTPVASTGTRAVIRSDGGGMFGYSRVARMIALARALRDREGIEAIFCIAGAPDALQPARAAGFEAHFGDADPAAALRQIVDSRKPDILVCDVRDGLPCQELGALRRCVSLVAVIDDASDARLAADIAWYPPLPRAERLDWMGSHCTVRIGWEWALCGLSQVSAPLRNALPRPTVLVNMSGSGSSELTLAAARALSTLDRVFRARFVIEPDLPDAVRLAGAIGALAPGFEIAESANDLAAEYASCDLALLSFGATAYEIAANGVPALYLCATPDHADSAAAFERAGMGISLGLAGQAQPQDIARAVWALLANPARRREMRAAALTTIDGEAASRIAADISRALGEKRSGVAQRAVR
ncbi:MAG TPA: hypothetical protein VII49_13275 [Rhizomicrobium sp.]